MDDKVYLIETLEKKRNVLLKLLNGILKNIGKNEITSVFDFKQINRDDLISEENEKLYKDMQEEIYEYYGKYNMKYNQKDKVKNYLLILLKAMCNDLKIEFTQASVVRRVGKTTKTSTCFSIGTPPPLE